MNSIFHNPYKYLITKYQNICTNIVNVKCRSILFSQLVFSVVTCCTGNVWKTNVLRVPRGSESLTSG